MEILFWIVFGLVAGAIASFIDPGTTPGGVIGTILLGIIGAVVGGFVGNALFGVDVTGFNLSSFIVAVAGSLLVLFLYRSMARST